MLTKCLLMCGKEVLAVALENILNNQIELEVIRVGALDEAQLIQAVIDYQPHVLIFDESIHLNQSSRLFWLLGHQPQLRVITLNDQDNFLRVYQEQRFLVTQTADFVAVVCHP